MINYDFKVNPHASRVGIISESDPIEKYYRKLQHLYGIVNTEDELMELVREARKKTAKSMAPGVDSHGLKVGRVKDLDSKWTNDNLYISKNLIHHSLENRKIHLVQLLGEKKYRQTVNKVKTLSR